MRWTLARRDSRLLSTCLATRSCPWTQWIQPWSSGKDFKKILWQIMVEIEKPNLADYFPILRRIDLQGARWRITVCFRRLLDVFDRILPKRLQDRESIGKNDRYTGYSSWACWRQKGGHRSVSNQTPVRGQSEFLPSFSLSSWNNLGENHLLKIGNNKEVQRYHCSTVI